MLVRSRHETRGVGRGPPRARGVDGFDRHRPGGLLALLCRLGRPADPRSFAHPVVDRCRTGLPGLWRSLHRVADAKAFAPHAAERRRRLGPGHGGGRVDGVALAPDFDSLRGLPPPHGYRPRGPRAIGFRERGGFRRFAAAGRAVSEPTASDPIVVRGACPHDCPDTCAWDVTVQDGRATTMRGAKDHPFTRGGLCAKLSHYLDRVYAPDRLLHPLRRVGPKGERRFERIGWDEALEQVAAELQRVTAEHGGQAVLPYSYMGTQGVVQAASLDRRFFARLGATRLVREVCGSAPAHGFIATQGGTKGMLPEDLRHSRFILLWGTNTIVTNLHLWPYIAEAREQGARVVVIDPIRTRTAQAADQHVRPRPGSDAALALGMMHVIVAERLHDADYVERYTLGFEALRERLQEYPPERVAALTGVAAEEIRS